MQIYTPLCKIIQRLAHVLLLYLHDCTPPLSVRWCVIPCSHTPCLSLCDGALLISHLQLSPCLIFIGIAFAEPQSTAQPLLGDSADALLAAPSRVGTGFLRDGNGGEARCQCTDGSRHNSPAGRRHRRQEVC